jgi:hypothetical protein
MDKDATRKLALAFAEAGFPVFPVDVFYDPGRRRWRKVPCIKDWGNRATTNRYLIEVWWRKWPLALPGVPPGRCGEVIVDADRHPGGSDGVELFRALGPFPPHPVIPTKSGGEHHWFSQPAQPIRWAKWAGGEVLGHGRFVVGYAVPQGERPELPKVFWKGAEFGASPFNNHMGTAARAIANATNDSASTAVPMLCGVGPPTEHEMNYAFRSLRNATGELWMCPKGSRNKKLNDLAFSMGRQIVRGWIARDRVEEFLLRACKASGLLDDDGLAQCRATIASGINAGMRQPYHDIDSAKLGGNR